MNFSKRWGLIFFVGAALFLIWCFGILPYVERSVQKRLNAWAARSPSKITFGQIKIHPLLLSARVDKVRFQSAPTPESSASLDIQSPSIRWLFMPVYDPGAGLSVGRIIIRDPRIVYKSAAQGSDKKIKPFPTAFFDQWPRWLVREVKAAGGQVDVYLEDESLHEKAQIERARAILLNRQVMITLTGRAWKSPVQISGKIERDGQWQLLGRIPEASVEDFVRPYRKYLRGYWGGAAEITGSVAARAPFDRIEWHLDTELKPLTWTGESGHPPAAIYGHVIGSAEELTFKNIRGPEGIELKGFCKDPFGPEPTVDFVLKGENVDLQKLNEHVSLEDSLFTVPVGGAASFEATLQGPKDDLAAHVELNTQNFEIAKITFPDLSAVFDSRGGRIEGHLQLSEGEMNVAGLLSRGTPASDGAIRRKASWEVAMKSIDLGHFARLNRWGDIGGIVNGHWTYQSEWRAESSQGSQSEGVLAVDKFRWGVHKETSTLSLETAYSDGRWMLRGGENRFHADIAPQGPDVYYVDMAFELPSGIDFQAKGTVQGPERNIDVDGHLNHLPMSEIPMLLARYPDVSGLADMEGRLTGKFGALIFEGRAAVTDAQLLAGGDVHHGQGQVSLREGEWTVHSLSLDDVWFGEARWSRQEGWALTLEAQDAPARFVGEIVKSSAAWSGAISGRFGIESHDSAGARRLKGQADIVWKDGAWGPVPFEKAKLQMTIDRDQMAVNAFDITQASGRFSLAGTLPPFHDAGRWSIVGKFENFEAGPVHITTPYVWEGRGRLLSTAVDGRARLAHLMLDARDIGAVTTLVNYQNGILNLKDVRGADIFTGDFEVNLTSRTVAGQGKIEKMNFPEWARRLDIGWPRSLSGALNARWSVKGPLSAPMVSYGVESQKAVWNEEDLKVRLAGIFRDGTFSVDSLRATLEKGGVITGSGELAKPTEENPTRQVHAVLSVKSMPFRTLMLKKNIGLPWENTFDAECNISGPSTGTVVMGTISGASFEWARAVSRDWGGRFQYQNHTITVLDFAAKTEDGLLRVEPGSQFSFHPDSPAAFNGTLVLRNIHFGVMTYFGSLEAKGIWTQDLPWSVQTDLVAHDLWVNQHRFNQDLARVRWTATSLVFEPLPGAPQKLAGDIDISEFPQMKVNSLTLTEKLRKRLSFQGEWGPRKWDFVMEGWDMEAQTLMSLADLDYPVDGKVDVHVMGQGDPEHPRVEGDIEGRAGSWHRVPYDRFESSLLWEGPLLYIRHLEVAKKNGYLLRGEGRIPVNDSSLKQAFLDVQLTNGDLAILKSIWPACKEAKGDFYGKLMLRSTPEGPSVTGSFKIEKGSFRSQKYVRDAGNINVQLALSNDKLVIEQGVANIGRGTLQVSGNIGLSGLDMTDYEIYIQTLGSRGIDLVIPELSVPPGPLLGRFSFFRDALAGISQGSPRLNLSVIGPDGDHKIAGEIVLDDTQFTYPPAKDAFVTSTPLPAWWVDFIDSASWDILFRTGRETWYRNEFVNVKIDGDIRLQGRPKAWDVSGKVQSTRGVLAYLGQSYNVKEAALEFVNDYRSASGEHTVTPYLSVAAERTAPVTDAQGFMVPDTITMVVKRAPIGEIEPQFISRNNPNLKSEQVAQKALGIESENSTPQDREKLLRAGIIQLVGDSAAPLASQLAHRFGIDMLYPIYDPPDTTTGPANQASASIAAANRSSGFNSYLTGAGTAAGVHFTDRVFGVYKVKVDERENQTYLRDEVELIYRWRGNLYIHASSELDSERLLGQPPNRQLIFENQWRFNPPQKPNTSEGS